MFALKIWRKSKEPTSEKAEEEISYKVIRYKESRTSFKIKVKSLKGTYGFILRSKQRFFPKEFQEIKIATFDFLNYAVIKNSSCNVTYLLKASLEKTRSVKTLAKCFYRRIWKIRRSVLHKITIDLLHF